MDNHIYKKERSSRQHLRIDMENSLSQDEGGGLLLSNPVACGSISPGGPMTSAVGGGLSSSPHPHTSHHLPSRRSPPSLSGNGGLTQSLNYTHTSASSSSNPTGSLTRGGSGERSSFGKGKNRSKSPALLRFFVRGSGGGGSRKTSEVEEEDYASSGSDHEDPFSPRSVTGGEIPPNSRHTPESLKAQSSVEHYATLPRQFRRYHSTGSSSVVTQRDSGFSSERESISHMKDDLNMTLIAEDSSGSPMDEDYHPAGMEALEVLHNQLQILVKQECDDEETDAANVYEQVIINLSRQIEELSNTVDCLRQSDQELRLSLKVAEQRADEAETSLRHTLDRNQRSEQKYLKLAIRYQALAKRHREMEKGHQRKFPGQRGSNDWGSSRSPLQRVQSQNQYDRENSASLDTKRPSTAQGFHSDTSTDKAQPPKSTLVSLSHTQTSV